MNRKRKFFGTDGIRGTVGESDSFITPKMMTKIGWALGKIMQSLDKQSDSNTHLSAMIGKDTRISGYMLESALEAGLIASGMDVYLLGPMPTPAIAYLTKNFRCDVGLAITASHNPYHDNGIKFFSSNGEKLADEIELEIEKLAHEGSTTNRAEFLGKAHRIDDAAGRYIEFCKSSFPLNLDLEKYKIVVDCANGSTYHIAPPVFRELGAKIIAIANEPNGLNINEKCGSNHLENLKKNVLKNKADLGIAFDGDGDRVILVDHKGNTVDGDSILYILATYLNNKKLLKSQYIIGTEMTNLGLEKAFEKMELKLIRTQVGDRYVRKQMKQYQSNLGGEASGHILYTDFTNTGDAIITALQVLKVMKEQNLPLADLVSDLKLYPNILHNIKINPAQKSIIASDKFQDMIAQVQKNLEDQGRIVIRASGTEAKLRILVETTTSKKNEQVLQYLIKQLKNLL